jgi:hypothetical protein
MKPRRQSRRRRLFGVLSGLCVLFGGAALLPRIAARSNTQVHRINQR